MRDRCPQRKRHCWCKRVSGVGPPPPSGWEGGSWLSLAQFFTLEKCSRAPGQRAEPWLLYRPLCTEVTPANTFPSAILLKVSLCSSSRL